MIQRHRLDKALAADGTKGKYLSAEYNSAGTGAKKEGDSKK